MLKGEQLATLSKLHKQKQNKVLISQIYGLELYSYMFIHEEAWNDEYVMIFFMWKLNNHKRPYLFCCRPRWSYGTKNLHQKGEELTICHQRNEDVVCPVAPTESTFLLWFLALSVFPSGDPPFFSFLRSFCRRVLILLRKGKKIHCLCQYQILDDSPGNQLRYWPLIPLSLIPRESIKF